MRKTDGATRPVPTDHGGDTSAELVCLALMLAMVALAWRILAVW